MKKIIYLLPSMVMLAVGVYLTLPTNDYAETYGQAPQYSQVISGTVSGAWVLDTSGTVGGF